VNLEHGRHLKFDTRLPDTVNFPESLSKEIRDFAEFWYLHLDSYVSKIHKVQHSLLICPVSLINFISLLIVQYLSLALHTVAKIYVLKRSLMLLCT